MRYYVKINGVSSLTIPGLAIRELPSISKTLMRNQKETIDGRDGDLITELGYSAYDKTLQIGLFGTYDINQIIAFFNQKGTIVFSDEDDKYYNFTILDQIDYDKLVKFRTASVRIHCQPFKYPLTETPIVVEPESVTAEGTDITLNNTGVAKLSVDLKGDTSQYTTTGKNLLPKGTSTTRGGVTFTVNEDGSITIDTGGSAASSGNYIDIYTSASVSIANDTTKTYTFTKGITNSNIGLDFFERVNGSWVSKLYTFNTSATYTPTGTQTGQQVRIFVKTGSIVSNVTVYPMVVEGTTPGDFEPYTAGASPNPTYPQEIKVVTGNQNILVRNRNLWDEETILGYYNDNGVWQTRNDILSSKNPIYVNPSESCYFKAPSQAYYTQWTSNGTFISRTNIPQGYGTLTLNSNCAYILFNLLAGYGTTYNHDIMINHGTTAIPYTPHQEQNYEINLGKNLFDESQLLTATGWSLSNGIYSGTIGNWYSKFGTGFTGLTFVANTQYTISFKGATTGGTPRIKVVYSDSTYSNINISGSTLTNYTYTSTNGKTISSILGEFGSGSSETLSLSQIQVERGTQATTYASYFTPIELCKIGTYQDTIIGTPDNWKIHREIGKYIATGTEDNITQASNTSYSNTILRFNIPVSGKKLNTNDTTTDLIKCNYFTARALNYDARTQESIAGHSNNDTIIFFIDTSRLSSADVTGFKAWLSNNKPVTYYALATPTEKTITNAALITQLNNLYNNAVSYLDQTNLSASGNLPFIMSASALKKGTDEAIINNSGNIYAKPILALEGNGIVGLYLDGTQLLSIDMSTYNDITIDTNNMEAYDPNTNQLRNRQVTGDYSKLKLQPGNNTLTFSGDLTSATISKYKRWL